MSSIIISKPEVTIRINIFSRNIINLIVALTMFLKLELKLDIVSNRTRVNDENVFLTITSLNNTDVYLYDIVREFKKYLDYEGYISSICDINHMSFRLLEVENFDKDLLRHTYKKQLLYLPNHIPYLSSTSTDSYIFYESIDVDSEQGFENKVMDYYHNLLKMY